MEFPDRYIFVTFSYIYQILSLFRPHLVHQMRLVCKSREWINDFVIRFLSFNLSRCMYTYTKYRSLVTHYNKLFSKKTRLRLVIIENCPENKQRGLNLNQKITSCCEKNLKKLTGLFEYRTTMFSIHFALVKSATIMRKTTATTLSNSLILYLLYWNCWRAKCLLNVLFYFHIVNKNNKTKL